MVENRVDNLFIKETERTKNYKILKSEKFSEFWPARASDPKKKERTKSRLCNRYA